MLETIRPPSENLCHHSPSPTQPPPENQHHRAFWETTVLTRQETVYSTNDIINTACGVLSLEKDSLQAISCKDLQHAEQRVTKVYVKLIPIIWNPLQNALLLFENITGFDFIDSTQEQFSARLLGLASAQAVRTGLHESKSERGPEWLSGKWTKCGTLCKVWGPLERKLQPAPGLQACPSIRRDKANTADQCWNCKPSDPAWRGRGD